MLEDFGRLLNEAWFGTLMVSYLCVMAFVTVIAATIKGRSTLWGVPCVLFPPVLILLVLLPTTKRAGQVRCHSCEMWNPIRRETCAKCGCDLDDSTCIV